MSAAAKKKPKRMANAEKRERAEARKEPQERGVLPPGKPKLDRKKYVEEAREAWDGKEKGFYAWGPYLFRCLEGGRK